MIQRNGSVTDEYSRPVPGATVYVYNQDGTDATLTLDGTTPVVEPITTDEWGAYSYFAAEGLYREDIWFGGKRRAVDYNVAIGDPGLVFKGNPGSPGEGYATRAAMQAAATAPTDGDDFYETETGGKWVYRAGNYASKVTEDTLGGIHRQAGAVATSTGALVRQFDGPVWAHWFGTYGDGVVGNVSAGHDDTAAFQAAVDLAITLGITVVKVRDGRTYRIDGTIRLGLASGFSTVALEGGGLGYSSGNGQSPTLYHTAKDRPCINFARGRGTGIRHLTIIGQNTIVDTNLHDIPFRATSSNYVTNSCQDTARAPYCAVAIDGDAGTAPSPAYGGMTYPGTSQGTSDWFVEDCTIKNFVVGVACQPNSDGNGDFGSLRGSRIFFCKAGASVGNANARCIDFSKANFYWCHTCVDGVSYRNVNKGNIKGEWANVHANWCYQLYNVALNYSNALTIRDFYCESTVRIGQASSASTSVPLHHSGCTFICDQQIYNNGSVDYSAYVTPLVDYTGSYSFDSCEFQVIEIPTFIGQPFFRNCFFSSFISYGSRTASAGISAAYSACYGVLLPAMFNGQTQWDAFADGCLAHTKGILGPSDTYLTSHIYAREQWSAGTRDRYLYTGPRSQNLTAGAFSSVSISGRVATFTCASVFDVGGFLVDNATRTPFVIETATGAGPFTYTATALCGWQAVSGTASLLTFAAFGTGSDQVYYYPAAVHFSSSASLYLYTTSGSPDVVLKDAAGAANGSVPTITTATRLFWIGTNLHMLAPFPVLTTISSINSGTSTITMSANARRTGVYRFAPGIAVIS